MFISTLIEHNRITIIQVTMAEVQFDEAVLLPLSITDRYSANMGLIYIFEELQLGENERLRIINDGLTSVERIVHQYNYDIKAFAIYLQNLNKTFANASEDNRVYYSPPVISQLCGLLFYFNHCVNTLHVIPDVIEVEATFMQENYDQYKELTDETGDDSDAEDIDIPTLKGHENWIKWREAFIANLSITIGQRGIPIDYLIDSTERTSSHGNSAFEEYQTVNFEDDNLFKHGAVHFGLGFKNDNTKLWKRLKSSLINTAPYNHISDFNTSKNGRAAWTALTKFYQGSDYVERMKDSAFATLKHAHYRGEAKNFTWEKYVNIHKEAHQKLMDAGYNDGRGMDEETKIHHLKANIRAEAGLENALLLSRSHHLHRTDFASFVSFIGTEVSARSDRLKQLKESTQTQRVAGIKGDKSQSNKSNNRNDDYKDRPSKFIDGQKVYGKKYSPNEFKKLTANQKKAVVELKRQYWRERDGKEHSNSKPSHFVKGLTAVQEDLQSLESRMVAAVQRASVEQNDDAATRVTFDDTSTLASKRKAAPSGSIGTFLANQRKQKKSTNEHN